MSKRASLFAIVREAECEVLKGLSANASKIWIAIRFGRKDHEPIVIGCRDFSDWGVGRSAAAKALQDLVDAGLLRVAERGAFGRRGKRTVFNIVHTKAFEREQSANADNKPALSPELRTTNQRRVPKSGQQTGKESVSADTPKDTSSTSSRKSEEEEVSVDLQAEADREERVKAQQESARRIERAAIAVAMTDFAFIRKAGGPKPADLLARSFDRGNLTPLQLRKRLADSEAGSAEQESRGPMVFSVAVGGACG
ncbi:MAG: hypothetical protein AAF936_10445 [Pseudomonadota bacterium]